MFKVGPETLNQMRRFGQSWEQGQHVLISGPTGSGKTELARLVDEERIRRGGYVMVLVGKLQEDPTIAKSYPKSEGWVRWDKIQKNPKSWENKILLWPKVERIKSVKDKRELQREVFRDAFDRMANIGKWTIHVDEGLYTVSPTFLNMADELAMLHAMGRSSKLSIVTLTQRPSHLPLIIYSSAAHAFVGRTREITDGKRMAELGGKESSRELMQKISAQGKHDFTWIPVAPDWPAESVNLSK